MAAEETYTAKVEVRYDGTGPRRMAEVAGLTVERRDRAAALTAVRDWADQELTELATTTEEDTNGEG